MSGADPERAGAVERVRRAARALALAPDHRATRLALAVALFEAGQHQACLDVLAPLLRLRPDASAVIGLRLRALLALGERAEVERYLEALAGCSPPLEASTVSGLAQLLSTAGELDIAAAWLERRGRGGKGQALQRARLLFEARRLAEADEAFAALEAPTCGEATRVTAGLFRGRVARARMEAAGERGQALWRLGRRAEARAAVRAGTLASPRSGALWRTAVAFAHNEGLGAEAQELLDAARLAFPQDDALDHLALADVAAAGEFFDQAIAHVERALALSPDDAEAHATAARLHLEAGNLAGACDHLARLAPGASRAPRTTDVLARASSARRLLDRASSVADPTAPPRVPEALFRPLVALGSPRSTAGVNGEGPILLVSSSLAAGGSERQVALTAAGLARRLGSTRVRFVADDLDPALRRDVFLDVVQAAGVSIDRLRVLHEAGAWRELLAGDPSQREVVRGLAALPEDLRRLALPMFSLFRAAQPAVVHLWQDMTAVAGGLAAALAGVPRIVLGVRSTRPVELRRARRYFHAAYLALLERPGVVLVANSTNGARDYEEWLGLASGSVRVIRNGNDVAALRSLGEARPAADVLREAGLPPDALVFGGVSRCTEEKRPELWTAIAIRLVRADPRVHAVLVGDGPMRDALVRQVEREGLAERIRFVGRQSPVEPWLRAMDLLYLASRTEGLPNVLIEAQALGTAVATMRVGGAPEAVREGVTGLVLDEAPEEQLAATLGALLADAATRSRFAEAGRTWVDGHFGLESSLDQWLELYAAP